jgi:hypothetical protein
VRTTRPEQHSPETARRPGRGEQGGVAHSLTASGTDLVIDVFGGNPFVEQFCESLFRSLCPRRIVGGGGGRSDQHGAGGRRPQTPTPRANHNTALGLLALGNNTTGTFNIAIGANAGIMGTTGPPTETRRLAGSCQPWPSSRFATTCRSAACCVPGWTPGPGRVT